MWTELLRIANFDRVRQEHLARLPGHLPGTLGNWLVSKSLLPIVGVPGMFV